MEGWLWLDLVFFFPLCSLLILGVGLVTQFISLKRQQPAHEYKLPIIPALITLVGIVLLLASIVSIARIL